MIINIVFPSNLTSTSLIQQKNIPCLCRIGKIFEIVFQDPLPNVIGRVTTWDHVKFNECAPSGAGGVYTHYSPAQISIESEELELYRVITLYLFYEDLGWCSVIENGEYSEAGAFWDEE
jgi:hypothetical protein